MLGAKGVVGSGHQRKPAIQANNGTQLHLLGLLGMCAEIIKGSLLGFIDRKVIKRRNILQRIEPRYARQQLLGRRGRFGREFPTTVTLSPRPRRLFLRFSLSLSHKRLPAAKITTEQVFYPQKRVGRATARPTHTLSLSPFSPAREKSSKDTAGPARREGFPKGTSRSRKAARTCPWKPRRRSGPDRNVTPSRPRA